MAYPQLSSCPVEALLLGLPQSLCFKLLSQLALGALFLHPSSRNSDDQGLPAAGDQCKDNTCGHGCIDQAAFSFWLFQVDTASLHQKVGSLASSSEPLRLLLIPLTGQPSHPTFCMAQDSCAMIPLAASDLPQNRLTTVL
jgi:hypothetical protein